MTADIGAFIRARLAEDEQVARVATRGPWRVDETGLGVEQENTPDELSGFEETIVLGSHRGGYVTEPEDAVHIGRHDPARVLRGVEAKRRIVELHEGGDHECSVIDHNGDRDGFHYVLEGDACSTLRLLASEFDTHEDYQECWKP